MAAMASMVAMAAMAMAYSKLLPAAQLNGHHDHQDVGQASHCTPQTLLEKQVALSKRLSGFSSPIGCPSNPLLKLTKDVLSSRCHPDSSSWFFPIS